MSEQALETKIRLPKDKYPLDPLKILGLVCGTFGVRYKEVWSARKCEKITLVRELFTVICRQETRLTLQDMGEYLKGSRTGHSAQFHQLRNWQARCKRADANDLSAYIKLQGGMWHPRRIKNAMVDQLRREQAQESDGKRKTA